MHKRILIADDHSPIRQVLKNLLSAALDIHDYDEAANGREAIEIAEKTKPDLIILDLAMPEMDGIRAAQYLKKSMPQIPIILFTIYDLGQNRAQELGVDAVVLKPEGLDTLSKEVHSLLRTPHR